MIELHDIDKFNDPTFSLEPEESLAGYVHVLPNGGWHAFRISTGYEKSGDGSLRDLEPGLWVTNLTYERVAILSRELRHVMLRSDGWLRLTSEQILSACGMSDVDERIAARFLATLTHRMHALTLEVLHTWNPEPRSQARFRATLRTKPSLATGIAHVQESALLQDRPSEKRITSIFNQTYQLGMFCYGRKLAPEGHLNLTFQFPRLSYAIALSRQPVPGRATWKVGARPADTSQDAFIDAARDIGAPLILRAAYSRSGTAAELVDAMVGANRNSDTYRSLFLPDEIDILRRRAEISVETAVVGEGWVPSSTARLIEALTEICGGRQVASNSFSANLLAENILASIFRRAPKDNGPQPAESIWIAARDRSAMFPVIEAFYDFGASLVSAQHGAITIQCPADPELLSGVMDTAWQFGLTLPIGDILTLTGLGVPIPSERSEYGGNPVDYGLSVIAQCAKKKALLTLDEIMDVPADERPARFRAIFS